MSTIYRTLFIVFILIHSCGLAQKTRTFRHIDYNIKDGLYGNGTYGIYQDLDSFIWIGDDFGLARFDGTSFNYGWIKNQRKPIPIVRMFKWKENSLLVFEISNKAYTLDNDGILTPILHEGEFIYGKMWSQSSHDLSVVYKMDNKVFVLDTNSLHEVYKTDKRKNGYYTCIKNFNKDSIFISTSKSAFLFGKDTTALPQLKNTGFVLDNGDSSLVFAEGKIYSLKDKKISLIKEWANGSTRINSAIIDRDENIWFAGNNNGLYLLQDTTIINVGKSIGVDGSQVTGLFKDFSDNIWILTNSNKVVCVLKGAFVNYSTLDGLSSNQITCLEQKNGNVYIGTNGGMSAVVDSKILNTQQLIASYDLCPSIETGLKGYIFNIEFVKDQILVASNYFNPKSTKCSMNGIVVNTYSAAEVFNDTIIQASWGKWHAKLTDRQRAKGFANYQNRQSEKEYFVHRKKNTKEVLVGTINGLYKTNTTLDRVSKINTPYDSLNPSFFDIVEQEGKYWFATSEGLMSLNPKGDWQRLDVSNGLVSNTINCIELDAKGRLWLGTNIGISLYYKGEFSTLTVGNGLISNSIIDVLFVEQNDEMWIGTKRGISKIELQKVDQIGNLEFPLKINRIEVVNDTVYDSKNLPNLKQNENNIKIQFSSINYINPTELEYEYRLLPVDTNWHLTSSNSAQFIGLSPKSYSFQVRSRTVGNRWGKIEALKFTIEHPFWHRGGFIIACILLSLLLFWIILKYRVSVEKRKAAKKAKLLNRINYLEQQALSLSMNPHFVFNSLNSIQHYYSHIKNREAQNFISDFAKLIRLNMDSTQRGNISIVEEVFRLELYLNLEKARFAKEFEFEFHLSPALKKRNPSIPSMLIQPLVENSIWHGILPSDRKGKLSISIKGEKSIEICVIDNGIGLRAARSKRKKDHAPKGLSITRERLLHLSKDNKLQIQELSNDKHEVEGTKVTILLHLQ